MTEESGPGMKVLLMDKETVVFDFFYFHFYYDHERI